MKKMIAKIEAFRQENESLGQKASRSTKNKYIGGGEKRVGRVNNKAEKIVSTKTM